MSRRRKILFITLSALTLFLFCFDLTIGSVDLSVRDVVSSLIGQQSDASISTIVVDIRLIKAAVALLGGAALSVSGLQMQTLFRNPLAGPYVLGISSGASLGVALFILGAPLLGIRGIVAPIGMAGAAWVGSGLVLLLIAVVGRKIKDIMVVLILGMMFSSGVSAVVQILQYLSNEESLKTFVIWTMGSLGDVTAPQLTVMAVAVIVGFILAIATIKPLNLMLLGEEYARSLGVDMMRFRPKVLISTTLLAGTVTAFCGPIGFVGLAVPHVARLVFSSADNRILLPGTLLIGASVLLFCDIISKQLVLPINAITSLLGIPVVVWIVMKNRSITV